MICVLREVNGLDQYVPASEAGFFVVGETLYTGSFESFLVKAGPSKSHSRLICEPRGPLATREIPSCVLRPVDGIPQYVPVNETPALVPGEMVYTGLFEFFTVRTGPSESHVRRIGRPLGRFTRRTVEEAGLLGAIEAV